MSPRKDAPPSAPETAVCWVDVLLEPKRKTDNRTALAMIAVVRMWRDDQ